MPASRASNRPARRSLLLRIASGSIRVLLSLLLIAGIALVALFNFEQYTLRPLLERLTETATGRVLSIDGELDLGAGPVVNLAAADIRLANADWGQPGPMLAIDRLTLSVDLWRLLDGVPAADLLEIDGARLLVERDIEGQSNWVMGAESAPSAPADTAPRADDSPALTVLPVIRSQLSNIAISVFDPSLSSPLRLHLATVETRADSSDELTANVDGAVNDRPFDLQARIAPVSQLLAAGAVSVKLAASSSTVKLDLDGEVDRLSDLQRVNAHLSLSAGDIAPVLATLGLPEVARGATEIKASLLPSANEHTLDVAARVGDLSVDAQARLQALGSFDGAALEVAANGPDLGALASLAGVSGLASQPFELVASASLEDGKLTIGDSRLESGASQLRLQGVMPAFPGIEGSNLALELSGPNYLDHAALFGIEQAPGLPPEAFAVNADLTYNNRDEQLFEARLQLADLEGSFDGRLGPGAQIVGAQLDYQLEGRNDGVLQRLLKRPVEIEGGYRLTGRAQGIASGYRLDKTRLTIGEYQLEVDGTVGSAPLQAGTGLSLTFAGPDLDRLLALAGYDGYAPQGAARIAARGSIQSQRLDLEQLSVQLGRNRLQASGVVGLDARASGSRIALKLEGDDIVEALPPFLHGFVEAGQAFSVDAKLAHQADRLGIDALDARLGENRLKASGHLSTREPLADTALAIDTQGPDLAAIVPASLVPYTLPAEAFAITGNLGLDQGRLVLDKIEAGIGKDQLWLSAGIPLATPTEGLELTIRAQGPNLNAAVPAELEHIDFAEQPYEVAAVIRLAEDTLSVRKLDMTLPRGTLAGGFDLSLSDPLGQGQFDLAASGSNLAEFLPDTPNFQPAEVAFDLDAKGHWNSELVHIDRGLLELGDTRIETSGEINMPAGGVAARLVLKASGERLSDFGNIKGITLPPEPFHVDMALDSSAAGIEIPRLDARLANSDLRGSLKVEFAEIPDIHIRLDSRLLDINQFLSGDETPDDGLEAATTQSNDGRVIPQSQVPTERLRSINFDTRIRIGELLLKRNDLREIILESTLQDGELNVSRVTASAREGKFEASFRVVAEGDRIVTGGNLEGQNIVLGKGNSDDENISFPEMDFALDFDTSGATTRELAANLNGYAQLTGGAGRLRNSAALGLFGSFFTELLSAINPFVNREPYTAISCFAAYSDIVDGVAVIQPGAVMQTDKLDMFARGQVDLNDEHINFRFDTSARKGIGISVADFVNPFVGVTGTLTTPRLGVDSKNAMFEGSFAYATGGLSIVAKSLYNRWFGNKEPCALLEQEAQAFLKEKRQARAAEGAEESE